MNSYRVIKYLVEGDVGLSAKAIINQYIDRGNNTNFNYPHDCNDLKRCVRAVNSLDLYNITHMCNVNNKWYNISNNWSKLVALLNTDRGKCYNLLKECINENN